MLYSILILIILFVLYLLWIPIRISIDTNQNLYQFQLKGLVKVMFVPDAIEVLKVNIKMFFMNFQFYPIRSKGKQKKEKRKPVTKRKTWIKPKTGFGILRSFKIKEFKLELDSGDFITNAKLFSIYAIVNADYRNIQINFQNRNSLFLILENRPIYILKSIVKF